jgi:hypothetical protein
MIRTPRILVADLHRHVGDTVSIAGWAQTLRLQRAVRDAMFLFRGPNRLTP